MSGHAVNPVVDSLRVSDDSHARLRAALRLLHESSQMSRILGCAVDLASQALGQDAEKKLELLCPSLSRSRLN